MKLCRENSRFMECWWSATKYEIILSTNERISKETIPKRWANSLYNSLRSRAIEEASFAIFEDRIWEVGEERIQNLLHV